MKNNFNDNADVEAIADREPRPYEYAAKYYLHLVVETNMSSVFSDIFFKSVGLRLKIMPGCSAVGL